MDSSSLKQTAAMRRLDVLEMVKNSGAGHIGGSMSSMDILTCLYYDVMDCGKIIKKAKDRDRFILSKGHCAEALYSVLADRGFFEKEALKSYAAFDTALAEHPTMKVPGIEAATGALGHGLSLGVGMAIALKADKIPANVYVLMGDGEQAEGSVWEAAMAAAKYRLDNLCLIIDRNRLQISGCTEDVMPIGDIGEKYRVFGWEALECNGHDAEEICKTLRTPREAGKPRLIVANTTKGQGSGVMADKAEWHHMVPTQEQYEQIKTDLQASAGGE